jgi:ketopantoate hydroxymethyltransferase
MSHVGMCPHFVHQYGGFKLQGRTAAEAMRIVDDGIAVDARRRYAAEVREGKFPDAEHSYGMKPEEQQELARLVSQRRP